MICVYFIAFQKNAIVEGVPMMAAVYIVFMNSLNI